MFTVVETPLFQKQWPVYWTEEERGEFAAFLAGNPEAGTEPPRVSWRLFGLSQAATAA